MKTKKRSFLWKWLNVSVAYLLLLPLRLLNLYLKDYSQSELQAVTYVGARYIWSFVILRETSLYLAMMSNIDNIVPISVMQRILWIPLLRSKHICRVLQMLNRRALNRIQMPSINVPKSKLIYRLFPFLLKFRARKLWQEALTDKRDGFYRISDPFRVNY